MTMLCKTRYEQWFLKTQKQKLKMQNTELALIILQINQYIIYDNVRNTTYKEWTNIWYREGGGDVVEKIKYVPFKRR
jgi:hypothetical protein